MSTVEDPTFDYDDLEEGNYVPVVEETTESGAPRLITPLTPVGMSITQERLLYRSSGQGSAMDPEGFAGSREWHTETAIPEHLPTPSGPGIPRQPPVQFSSPIPERQYVSSYPQYSERRSQGYVPSGSVSSGVPVTGNNPMFGIQLSNPTPAVSYSRASGPPVSSHSNSAGLLNVSAAPLGYPPLLPRYNYSPGNIHSITPSSSAPPG